MHGDHMRIDSALRTRALALCKGVMMGVQVESSSSIPPLVLEKRSLRRSVQSKLKALDVATKQMESGYPSITVIGRTSAAG